MISLQIGARELFNVTKRLEYEAKATYPGRRRNFELEAVCLIIDLMKIKTPKEA